MAKRPVVISESEESGADVESAGLPEKGSSSKRLRVASTKQLALEVDAASKESKKLARSNAKLRKELKELKASQKRQTAPHKSKGTIDNGDPDRLPLESEEGAGSSSDDDDTDDDGTSHFSALAASIRKKATAPVQVLTPRISRRENDALAAQLTGMPADSPTATRISSTGLLPTSTGNNNRTDTGHPLVHPALPNSTPTPSTVPTAPATSAPASQAPFQAGAAAAPAPPPPPPPPPHQAPNESDPGPVDAPFQNGVVPQASSRPKVGDYVDPVRSLILSAIEYYSCSILTVDAFPSDAKQDEFVKNAWRDACAHSDHPRQYLLSDRMKRLIGKRKSNARGDASDLVRPQTGSAYKFRDGTTISNERYNVALYTKLTDKGAFHHKGIDDATGKLTGFAQHPYISQALRHAFFKDSRSGIGFKFPDAFDPIRTETVALILTIIRFHIEEWATGKHVPGQFKEAEYARTYRDLIKDLKKWSRSCEDVWKNIRSKWYKRAYRAGGGTLAQSSDVRVPDTVMEDAQAELEGRTGHTDSEGEDGGDEPGSGGLHDE